MLFSISRSSIIFLLFVFIISGGKSKLWGKEGKSEEEINSAYYCAKKDVYRYEHWVDKKLFPALLKLMKNPQLRVPTFHVTGTNGKGSVVRKLGACLLEAGYRVGEYTSPGMLTDRENIRLNGKIISQANYVKYHQICMSYAKQIYTKNIKMLGANSMQFCMALQFFIKNKVQAIIVEVFMGGRNDHTNVLKPAVSIITNIALDHYHVFGRDPNKILYEKSGIIKRKKPVVFGYDMNRELAAQYAKQKKSPYYFVFPDNPHNFTFDHLNAKIVRKALEVGGNSFKRLKEKHLNVGLKAKLMARLEEVKPKKLDELGEKWNLPKLPVKVYNEFKTNFMSIKQILTEMRQKHGNITLRVVLSMSKIYQQPTDRIKYILERVDYLHLIETTRKIAIPFSKLNITRMLEMYDSRIDSTKFTFSNEEVINGTNSIETTIRDAFRASSLNKQDEIILIWGVFWSSIKLFRDDYDVDQLPNVIPTPLQCKQQGLILHHSTPNISQSKSKSKIIIKKRSQRRHRKLKKK